MDNWFEPMYISIDTETGGISIDRSLLTAYFSILNPQFDEIKSLYLELKPSGDDPYLVDAEGMEINGIDLVEHNKRAISLSEGGKLLRELLKDFSYNGKNRLTPIGHGINFDMRCIQHHLLNKHEINKYLSYRTVDTAHIAKFLQIQGKVPDSVSGSLTSLIEHFNLKSQLPGRAHTADYDAKASALVLREMLKL